MIQTEQLTRLYGAHRAVDGVSFNIECGEIVGFLGPNGAGKTTTMRMLTSFLPPSSGRAIIAGHDVVTESIEVRRKVGYLPETTPLYPELRVDEYLRFMGRMRAMDGQGLESAIGRAIESCALEDVVRRPIGELSKGYRQRVCLAQATLHDPDVLILDEPTSGLDPTQVVEVRDLIAHLGKQKTVILSTHILSEVQAVCSRAIIIAGGRIVADGAIHALHEAHGDMSMVLVEIQAPEAELKNALASVQGVAEVHVRPEGGRLRAEARVNRDIREDVFKLAVARGWTLVDLHRRVASLEEIFIKLTTGSKQKSDA